MNIWCTDDEELHTYYKSWGRTIFFVLGITAMFGITLLASSFDNNARTIKEIYMDPWNSNGSRPTVTSLHQYSYIIRDNVPITQASVSVNAVRRDETI